MTELVGAKRIAAKLAELAGTDVTARQVYHLAKDANCPINSDREKWRITAYSEALEQWWAETFDTCETILGKRLLTNKRPAQGADMARMRIFGVIGDGELTDEAFLAALDDLGSPKTLQVSINSEGGIVSHGLAMYHALRQHKARVEVEIAGVAASMASAIAMAGEKVSMAEDGLLMLHDPWTGSVGNAEDLRAAADMLEKNGDSLAQIYARKTGISEDRIKEMMGKNGGSGTWMNAEEALEAGFVDEVLSPANARLPDLPAVALAKRITRKRKGTMNKFVKRIAAALKAHDSDRADLVDEIAEAAEVESSTVEKILDGKRKTVKASVLAVVAKVLDVDEDELTEDAEASEITIEAEKPDEGGEAVTDKAVAKALEIIERRQREDRKLRRKIVAEAKKHGIAEAQAREISEDAEDLAEARGLIIEALAKGQKRVNGMNGSVIGGDEDRDKWLEGMEQWLVIKSGAARMVEAHIKRTTEKSVRLDPGEFRGFRLIDIARDSLERAGVNVRGLSPREIAKRALVRAESGLGTTSDFPVLLENVLHKMLLAAYETAQDQWRMVATTGSVQDFRAHPRLRLGSLPALSDLLESGEFKQLHFPDATKETIQAATKGNIIGLTRQAIVNDDVDGFSRLTTMLGRAAARSIEIDVFALFGLNSGLGPTMNDSNALFDAAHNNIASTAGTPTQALLEESRVLMAQQKDRDDNDFLNLRPAVWVGPIGLGATVRTSVNAEFDFDAETSGNTGKFMKPNVVRDLVSTIVDTPRLTGDRWYLLADPAVAPVFEVVFLEGQESPVIETEEGFDYDGVRWRIRHDYGVGATDFVGATTNAGA